MPPVRTLSLALLLVGCAHAGPAARPPEPAPAPAAAPRTTDAELAHTDTTPPAGRTVAQEITFDDDADPEPTTQVRGAPERPPIPAFKLFGTREGDGPG